MMTAAMQRGRGAKAPRGQGPKSQHSAAGPLGCSAPDLHGLRIHFVGIGGCGMSGLARIAQAHGAMCTGSDQAASPTTDALQRDGLPVTLRQTADTLPRDCQLLVISAAIGQDHPELAAARERGVTVLKYAQMLGQLMIGRTGVAIAGTHGKSSTTSMLSHILIQAGLDPSLIVGANCAQIGGGSRVGGRETRKPKPENRKGSGQAGNEIESGTSDFGFRISDFPDILVAEACEYDRSFHSLHPTLAAILNVEADHMDVYASLDEIVEAFAVFARRLPPAAAGGYLLINHEMPARLQIAAGLDCATQTIGFAYQADWRVGMKDGQARLHHRGQAVMDWRAPLPGEHMAYNAAAAAVLAHQLGAPWPQIAAALESFEGLDRRMQVVGRKGTETPSGPGAEGGDGDSGVGDASFAHPAPRPLDPSTPSPITVIDDYGHHPTEVDTTLRALRQHYRPDRLICVFQPHQHSRTRFLMQQFAASFSQADIVIVPDIYFVRDSQEERQAVTAGDLVDRLRQQGVTATHLHPFDAIVEHLQTITRPGDLVVTMGAGDVWKIAHAFIAAEGPGKLDKARPSKSCGRGGPS